MRLCAHGCAFGCVRGLSCKAWMHQQACCSLPSRSTLPCPPCQLSSSPRICCFPKLCPMFRHMTHTHTPAAARAWITWTPPHHACTHQLHLLQGHGQPGQPRPVAPHHSHSLAPPTESLPRSTQAHTHQLHPLQGRGQQGQPRPAAPHHALPGLCCCYNITGG